VFAAIAKLVFLTNVGSSCRKDERSAKGAWMDLSQFTLAALRAMDPQTRERTIENLVLAVSPSLLRRAYAILNDRQLSEDVCQEAWLLVTLRMPAFLNPALFNGHAVPAGPLSPWLHGVVTRMALYKLRERSKLKEMALEKAVGPIEDCQSGRDIPSGLRQDMESAVGQLTSRQRDVLALRYEQKRSFEAIAGLLGISPRSRSERPFRHPEAASGHPEGLACLKRRSGSQSVESAYRRSLGKLCENRSKRLSRCRQLHFTPRQDP
jgi:RNA polymerase sigma factor (sigma-70 family)